MIRIEKKVNKKEKVQKIRNQKKKKRKRNILNQKRNLDLDLEATL